MTPTASAQPRPLHPLGLLLRVALGFLILGVAVALYAVLSATRPAPAQTPIAEVVRPVRTVTTRLVETRRAWEGYGTARALFAADVAAEVAGTVVDRPARIQPGAWVDRGELIVAIDPSDYEQRLARARQTIAALRADLEGVDVEEATLNDSLRLATEALRLARWESERLGELQARGAANAAEVNRQLREVTRVEREEQQLRQQVGLIPVRRQRLEAQIDAELAAAAMAETDVRRSRVTAPIAGTLQTVDAQVGERLVPDEAVARIVDLRTIEVPVRLPLSAKGAVRPGDSAQLRERDTGRPTRRGVVARIAPEADPGTRTITVFVEVRQDPADSDALTPGQFIRVGVEAQQREERIVVPRSAVSNGRVLVVGEDGRARERAVDAVRNIEARFPDLEPVETQWTVIGAGLSPGERVIVSNLEEVTPGSLLEAVDAAPPGGSRAGGSGPTAGRGASP